MENIINKLIANGGMLSIPTILGIIAAVLASLSHMIAHAPGVMRSDIRGPIANMLQLVEQTFTFSINSIRLDVANRFPKVIGFQIFTLQALVIFLVIRIFTESPFIIEIGILLISAANFFYYSLYLKKCAEMSCEHYSKVRENTGNNGNK